MAKWDDLVGVPFAYGGRGPDTFDCYGLVRELYARDGISIPDYTSPTDGGLITAMMALELYLWEECAPTPGAVVLFRVPGNSHVGYLTSPTHFVHTWAESNGVLRERLSTWERRVRGFYRYVGP